MTDAKETKHRLALKKNSNQRLIKDIENVISGYENDEAAESYSFCSGTISWYNQYLRYYTHAVIFMVIICVFLNSYMIVFDYSFTASGFGDLADMMYIILMFLRSRTGHLIDGVEERNLLKVRERYQTSIGFFLDLVTILPFSFLRFILPGEEYWYRIIDKQKIYLRLHYVLYYIGCRQEEPGSSTVLFRTTLYVTLSSMVIHFSAIGFYGISCSNAGYGEFRMNKCRENSWLYYNLLYKMHERLNIESLAIEADVRDEVRHLAPPYIISLYWAAHSSFSTGFGDVHAFTIAEKLFSVIAMLNGVGFLYGMAVSGITSMLLNADARRASFVHYYEAFNSELDCMHVSDPVKDVCRRYCDYIWQRFKGLMVHEMGTLEILPDCLLGTFEEYTFQPLLGQALFLKHTEGSLCRNLARASKHKIYLKNQYVQRAGEIADAMCYVHRGLLQVFDEKEENVIATISEGECFGEAFLLFDLPRLNTIRCLTDCELLWLDKHAFSEVIVEYPEASDQIKNVVRERCLKSKWPLDIPSISDSTTLEKIMRCRRTGLVEDAESMGSSRRNSYQFDKSASDDVSGAIRMTEVATTDYEGIGLSCVNVIGGPKALTEGGEHSIRIEEDGSHEPSMTLFQRIEKATIFYPNGKYYKLWEKYLVTLSLVAFLFQSTMFSMHSMIKKGSPCSGPCLVDVPTLDIAIDMEEDAAMKGSLQSCSSHTNYNDTIECLIDTGCMLSERIYGNLTSGYTIDIPPTWDVTIMGYNVETLNGWIHIFISYIIIDLSLYLHIFVMMRTVIQTSTGDITSFRGIGKYYLTMKNFGVDLFYVFPFEILSPILSLFQLKSRAGKHVWWLVLRNNRALAIFRHFPRIFGKWKRSLTANIVRIKLTYVIIICYCIVHVLAVWLPWSRCSYSNPGWVKDAPDDVYPEYSYSCINIMDYAHLMYICSMIITSTGYGEYPATVADLMIVSMLAMTLGTIMCGWIIAVISSMTASTATAVTTYTNNLLIMKRYLLKHSVPLELTNRAVDCRYVLYSRYLGDATPGEGRSKAIDAKLQLNLHQMLVYESFKSFIQHIPLFDGLHPATITKLCNNIDAYQYSEGSVIIYEGDMCGGLYIIKQGHCVVVNDDLMESFDVLYPGDYFGEVEIFHGRGSARTVVADTSAEVLFLDKNHIIDVIATFPALNSEFVQIADDTQYHDSIVHNIHLQRNEERRIDMSKRFHIRRTKGGILYYGDKIFDTPSMRKVTSQDNTDDVDVHPFLKSLAKIFLMPVTFDPGSKAYLYYETFRMVAVVMTLFLTPYQMSFMPNIPGILTLHYILDGLCLVDQYIKLHTMYYNNQKVLVSHPLHTARHYLKTSFIFDLISWFPFELAVMAVLPRPWTVPQWRFICFFRIPHVLQLHKLTSYFNYWQSDVRWKRRLLKHCVSVLYTFLLHNLAACIMYITFAQPERYHNNFANNPDYITLDGATGSFFVPAASWVGNAITENGFPALDLANSDSHRYLLSLYYVTATLVSVGYGDIVAKSRIEKTFCCLWMYLGIIYYALTLGDIAAIIQIDDNMRAVFKKRMMDIRKYFKLNHVSKETTNQVINFYLYLWERTGGVAPNDLLRGLPPSVKANLCHCMYDDMIRESFQSTYTLAQTNISKKDMNGFFNLLSTFIHPQIFLGKSVIFSRNSVGEDMYFVQRGNVAILDEDDETVKRVLGPGQYFGEIALFSLIPRTATIVALTNCDLSVLSKHDLDYILDRYPQFRDVMSSMALDRKLKGASSISYLRNTSLVDISQNLNVVYDEDGNRNDGQDKYFYSKIIDRNSKFSHAWDKGTILLAWLSSSLLIYQACFLNHNSGIDTVLFLIDVWFVMDMIICFHKSYYDKMGDVVETLGKIHAHYGKDWRRFFLDLLTNFPFEIFVFVFPVSQSYATSLALISYLRLNRIFRMRKFFMIFATWERNLQNDTLLLRMCKLVLMLFYIINVFSSVFYLAACPGGTCGELTWTTMELTDYKNKGIRGDDLLPWVDGCYWTVATMTSTGYGDIRPKTATEIAFAICVMVSGKVLIGYILSILAATLANDDARKVWYEEQVNAVKEYMKDMKFDKSFFDHVEQYYNYIWMKNQGAKFDELFNDLCYTLKADIMYQLIGHDIEKNELFSGCSKNFIRHVCLMMTSVSYMPSDYICLQDDVRSNMFVIHRGVAEIFKHDVKGKDIPVRLIMKGESLLTTSVLETTRLSFSVRARTYVDVHSLTKDNLKRCIDSYPHDGDIVRTNAANLHPTSE